MTTSPPAPPTVSARREITRQKLFAAARELFAKEGLGKTGVKTLCEAAGFPGELFTQTSLTFLNSYANTSTASSRRSPDNYHGHIP